VLELCYFEGRSCAEIAEIMQCPVSTVKTRMFHARRRLRALMAESLTYFLLLPELPSSGSGGNDRR
jgi:RNA polymerase sigma-70 factor (ECF subfamily)